MQRRDLRWAARVAALALTFVLPSVAQAASAPTVTTGGVANLTFNSVRLTGTVDPNGASTKWQFQIGTTSNYGGVYPAEPGVLNGDGKKTVTVDVPALAPATLYHYRLAASNSVGSAHGSDRTFKTKNEPLGLTLTATPNPMLFGATTTVSGNLKGTGNDNRQVILESNPFPYTQGFKQTGDPHVTDKDGNFSFGLQAVPFNTQFRVRLPDKTSVSSPIVVVYVQPTLTTHTTTLHVHKGGKVRFTGVLRPGGLEGTPIAIQKSRGGRWITVAGTAASHRSADSSKYRKTIRVKRGGRYRVLAGVVNGMFAPNFGRTVTIHVIH
jgi:hypothetical protein